MKTYVCAALAVFVMRISPIVGQTLGADYDNSSLITIETSMVSGSSDFNDFVLLIALENCDELRNDPNGDVQSASGFDIVFGSDPTDLTANAFKHDLEFYNSVTGEIIVWVQIDLSASVDTELYMFFGNAGIGADQSDNSLWTDAGYIGVWQLSETPGTNAIVDATGNSADGSAFGNVTIDNNSVVGQGYAFDGAGDYVIIDDNATIEPAGSFTISCWFKTAGDQPNDYAKMFSKGDTGAPYGSYTLEMRPRDDDGANHNDEVGFQTGRAGGGGGDFVLTDSNQPVTNPVDIENDKWYYFAGVIDDAGGPDITQTFYLTGQPVETSTDFNTQGIQYYGGDRELTIGGIYDGGINNEFFGSIDELRLADEARSADYILTEVRNTACVGNHITFAGLTSTAACVDPVLPVTFSHVAANRKGDEVVLSWTTSSEENNDYFSIEKSLDGEHFVTIGTQAGAGNSSNNISYAYTDDNANEDIIYYRIKQTDFDGQFDYSKIQKVIGTFQNDVVLNFYPNPNSDRLVNLTLGNLNASTVLIEVINLSGQMVYQQQVKLDHDSNYFSDQIDLRDINNGTYVLSVKTETQQFNELLILN